MKNFIKKIITIIFNISFLKKFVQIAGFQKTKDFEFFLHHIKDHYIYSKKIPSIIYVGAHNGSSAVKISEIIEYKNIYLFEPNSELITSISSKNIPNATLINQAVDNCDDENVIFNIAEKDSISSLKELNIDSSWYRLRKKSFNTKNSKFIRQEKVKVKRLSTFINENNIESGEILIIDTQGNSLNVLKSCEHHLNESFFDFIFVEIIFDICYGSKEKIMDIESYLDQFGYATVGQHSESSLFEDCGQVDMIYGNRKIISAIEEKKLEVLNKF